MTSRWFWRLYWPIFAVGAVVFVFGPLAGPLIEARYRPIRGEQSVQVVERTSGNVGAERSGRLCWVWTFVKLSDAASPDLDGFLVINGRQGGVAAPFDKKTGRPWGIQRYAVPPRSEPYRLVYCVALPPYVGPADTVRIRQTAYYPGWLGLWTLSVPFPDVVDRGDEQSSRR